MSSSRAAAVFSCLALGSLAAAFLSWTWLAWPDLLIDFGREAYVAWRIADGEQLYADLAYFNGPFSPYWNALLVRLFGPGLGVLFAANAVLTGLLAGCIYRLTLALCDGFSAFVCTAVFVTMFAFGHLVSIGNYNYLAPYSHELTHGLLLLAFLLGFLWRYSATGGSVPSLIGAGLCLGLSFLTKAEIFLAAGAATVSCLGSLAWRGGALRPKPRALLAAGLATLLPVLVAALALGQAIPLGDAISGILGTWGALGGSEVASLDFYRRGAGLDAPLENLLAMGGWALADALVLALLVAVARRLPTDGPRGQLGAAVAFCASFLALWLAMLSGAVDWPRFWRPLPLAMLGLAALNLGQTRRAAAEDRGPDPSDPPQERPGVDAVRLATITAAGVLLAKMALNARLAQYGFALAMPATLVAIAALLHGLPMRLPSSGSRNLLRAASLGLVAAIVLVHVQASGRQLARKNFQLETAHGTLRTDSIRGPVVSALLDAMSTRMADGASVLVLPEGVMLNYLSRHPTPTRHLNFMPPELAIYGEAEIVRELADSPPDWVLLVHKDTSEYGAAFFGLDYGLALAQWVGEHYEPVERFGRQPFKQRNQFGAVLLQRRP